MDGKGPIGQLLWIAPQVMFEFYEEVMSGNHSDPWVTEVNEEISNVFGAISNLPNAPFMSYEQAILNELVELDGRVGGPLRLPYHRLPEEARTPSKRLFNR